MCIFCLCKGTGRPCVAIPFNRLARHRLVAVAVVGGQDRLDDGADEAQQAVDDMSDNLGSHTDAENNVGQDAEADETANVSTDLADDVEVVLAALGALGHTVGLAVSPAELAGPAVDGAEDASKTQAETDAGLDVSHEGAEAIGVGVEEDAGVNDALEVETRQTTAHVLEIGADAAADIDLGPAGNLELNRGRGDKGDGGEAGLAVLVLGVVLADLGGGLGTVCSETDAHGRVDADVGFGPRALDDVADTDVGIEVELLAGRARAGLGPGAVAHGLGALEAAVLLAGGTDVDAGADVGVDRGSDLDIGLDHDTTTGIVGGRGEGGKPGNGGDETHLDVSEK